MLKATLHQLYIIAFASLFASLTPASPWKQIKSKRVGADLRYRSDLAPCWTERATRGQTTVIFRGQRNIRDHHNLYLLNVLVDSSKDPSAIPPKRCERRPLVTSARLKCNRCFYFELLSTTKLSIWGLVKPPEPSWRAELIYPLTDL